MVKGWFVGAFSPAAFDTTNCEVAIKIYKEGDSECAHYHKIATEITMVVEGNVRMMGQEFGKGDIIVLEPGEVTAFESLTEAINVVVKVPGALNDKFIV
jgi:quercetin dioxygenase-like cupin family protein